MTEIFFAKIYQAIGLHLDGRIDDWLDGEKKTIKIDGDKKGWVRGKIDEDGQGFVASVQRWSRGDKVHVNHRGKGDYVPRPKRAPHNDFAASMVGILDDKDVPPETLAEVRPLPASQLTKENVDAEIIKMKADKKAFDDKLSSIFREGINEAFSEIDASGGIDVDPFKDFREEELPPPALPKMAPLIEEIADHIMATSRRPCPIMAKGAALAIMSGAACKANVYLDCDGITAYPHLYLMILAPSGGGKNVPQAIAKGISSDCGFGGSGDYKSDAAILKSFLKAEKNVETKKTEHVVNEDALRRLDIQGEASALLNTINSRNAPPHQINMSNILCDLYTVDDQFINLGRYASQDNAFPPIPPPRLSYLGFSTIANFERGLSAENMDSGLLPRFFLFISQGGSRKSFLKPGARAERSVFSKKVRTLIDQYLRPGGFNMSPDGDEDGLLSALDSVDAFYFGKPGPNSRGVEIVARVALVNAFARGASCPTARDVGVAQMLFDSVVCETNRLWEKAQRSDDDVIIDDIFSYIKKRCEDKGYVPQFVLQKKFKALELSGKLERVIKVLLGLLVIAESRWDDGQIIYRVI